MQHTAGFLLALLSIFTMASVCHGAQPTIDGLFCGVTANDVLTLQFNFSGPGTSGNATFQMIDFGVERFPVCQETFVVSPTGDVSFPLFDSAPTTDCMAVQLQLMWITGFAMAPSAIAPNGAVEALTMTVGAFAMGLTRQCPSGF